MAATHGQLITRLLHEWRNGDPSAAERLVAATYHELRRIAQRLMQHERAGHTLQATALVHEAYVRLVRGPAPDLSSRQAFFGFMAAHMRRHLIDHGRRRAAGRRGGGASPVPFDEAIHGGSLHGAGPEAFLDSLDDALARLAAEHPRAASALRLRYYAGLSVDESATRLGVSSGTVKRDVASGRAWLLRELTGRRATTEAAE